LEPGGWISGKYHHSVWCQGCVPGTAGEADISGRKCGLGRNPPRSHWPTLAEKWYCLMAGGDDVAREIIFLVEEAAEGGWQARGLDAPIFTEAEDLAGLKAMVRDAVRCHFEDQKRPEIIRFHIVREEVVAA